MAPYTPGHSSPPMDAGPSSSPSGKTEITEPSPQIVRKPQNTAGINHYMSGAQGHSAVAQGKQPVKNNPLAEPQTPPSAVLVPTTPYAPVKVANRDAVYLNDMDPRDDTFVSRYLVIDQFPETVANGQELPAVCEAMKNYIRFDTSVPMVARSLRIRFDNLSHACEAQYILEQLGYVVKYSTMQDHAKAKGQESSTCDVFEGQVRLTVMITTQLSPQDLIQYRHRDLLDVAQCVASFYGTIRDHELIHVTLADQGVFKATFRIEFQSIDSASRCIPGLTAAPVRGPSRDFEWQTDSVGVWTDDTPKTSPQPPRVDAHGRLVGFLRTEIVPERALTIPTRHPADLHNRVTAPRILDGEDTRTTIMLRNIPNKLDWLALKQILDKYCFGLYDFIYLRIDFSSGNNVGYAFVNFVNTNGVLAILDKLDGQNWEGWRSNKAAEVSYATIQGKDALIQKFRNSSVMREAPYCRPRLFYSYDDEGMDDINLVRRLGCEAPFPEPDNPAKLTRSMENARSMGLFPAHSSNEMEHRNRHSMYDRGTPRDQLQTAMYQMPSVQNFEPQLQGQLARWINFRHPYMSANGIPPNVIQQFFAENPWLLPAGNAVAHNPGVIGRPPVIPNAVDPFRYNDMAQALPSSYQNARGGSTGSPIRSVGGLGMPIRFQPAMQPIQAVQAYQIARQDGRSTNPRVRYDDANNSNRAPRDPSMGQENNRNNHGR